MRRIAKAAISSAEAFDGIRSRVDKAFFFLNSFVPVILTPEEIASYTKEVYEKETFPYADEEWIERGLNPSEQQVIERHGGQGGAFLILGCGGGREAIALVKRGFQVTGIDSSEKMIAKAKEVASREGFPLKAFQVDFLEGDLPEGPFDTCLLTCCMYSVIPSRAMRVRLLSKIQGALGGGGLAIIHFMMARKGRTERLFPFRQWIAKLVQGNLSYQIGDTFHPPGHFFRLFLDEGEVVDEIREAGLRVVEVIKDFHNEGGMYAVMEKTVHQGG